ncbi:extracellular solute-binding protein [Bordetella sp. BOR01]|uniref:extracellular solute-binding protein n=1 Tax=Bordetella sp. BOR01 TaxID=2854779 RepID=UPI001C47CE95|nr:extracellular solute-binding protein [Bordetella sp. BOR01]MBV7486397.1 extracellular solute-binding protein [Bordetella sp. BOR01]
MKPPYRGLTWDHPRGYAALRAAAERDPLIEWNIHPLEGFESSPIASLCAEYDLVVLDHPHLGEALAHDCLRPLDEVFEPADLARIAADTIGREYASYTMAGRQWALPLDAATQVMAARADLLDAEPPADWDAVRALSARTGKVAMSLAGPHAFLSFLSIAAALDPAIDLRDGGRWHAEAVATEACALLAELARRSPASVRGKNPIGLLAHMSTQDDVVLCPLVYGYVNYASAGLARRLSFHDAPAGAAGVPGSILGGTGIALSRRCAVDDALRAHLLWLMSEPAQTAFIPIHDGQPSHRRAWNQPPQQMPSPGFYRQTVRTLQAASIRPRHAGYIAFQDQASALLRDRLAASPPTDLARALARLHAASHTPGD